MECRRITKLFVFLILFFCFWMSGNISNAGHLSSDIDAINDTRYPGIKSQIKNLQKKYGNYHFKVYYTDIDWTEAVTMEYQGHFKSPKNLFSVSGNYKGKWYCPICGSRTYDTGWYCASVDAIKYMMDPRNSMDETSIYQFKNLETADVASGHVQAVINNKYASYSYLNNPTTINAIINASNHCSMNAYSILAKIVNEQGRGTSPFATGAGYNGQYIGYYNFFNIGAYGNGTSTVMLNGLKYAYNHGWNSVESSIIGGSEYYKSQYIGRGQNTLYYQRFNVVYTPSLFSHQYQQDIMGAQTSATLLKNYYSISNTLTSVNHEFIIPLYENMPATACARPSTTQASVLEYEEAKVLTNRLPVKASPNSNRIISYLNVNEEVKVLERAKDPSKDGNYWDIIVSDADGTYGYVMRSGISQKIVLPNYVFDAKYYADHNSDIKAAFGYDEQKLIQHFVNHGISEGRQASLTFAVKYYVEANPDIGAAFGMNYQAAFEHFIKLGYLENRKSSVNYDGTFYKYFHGDLMNFDSLALMSHYINYGYAEGRMGSIDTTLENLIFNMALYADANDDVRALYGYNYFELRRHWLVYGIKESRIASWIFNPEEYRVLNYDLDVAFGKNYKKLLEHFVKHGMSEGRQSNSIFSAATYLHSNADLAGAYGSNYKALAVHFTLYGIHEKRPTSAHFNIESYMNYNPDLVGAYGTQYKSYYCHYLVFGKREGRRAL